jgi:hypothetical protein
MIELMVYGQESDPAGQPMSFLAAAAIVGIKPPIARRWVHESRVRQRLLAERRAYRAAINSGNENALRQIRDGAANSMSRVAAIRALENLAEDDEVRSSRGPGAVTMPGLVVVIERDSGVRTVNASPVTFDPPAVIEARAAVACRRLALARLDHARALNRPHDASRPRAAPVRPRSLALDRSCRAAFWNLPA